MRLFILYAISFLFIFLFSCNRHSSDDHQPIDICSHFQHLAPLRDEQFFTTSIIQKISEVGNDNQIQATPLTTAAEVLDDRSAQELLSQLTPLPQNTAQAIFSPRSSIQPLPQKTIKENVSYQSADIIAPPLPQQIDNNIKAKKFTITRMSPQGEIRNPREFSFTFSRPMVNIKAVNDIVEINPVTFDPPIKGFWRWLNTTTLVFNPVSDDLPWATEYRAIIDKQTQSVDSVFISGELEFTFYTAPVRIVRHFPTGNNNRTDVPVIISFNQRIDPLHIKKMLTIEVDDQQVEFHLMDHSELDKYREHLKKTWPLPTRDLWKNRCVLLSLCAQLKPSQNVVVTLKQGTSSAEGPLVTREDQSFSFRTHDSLTIKNEKYSQWNFTLNNQLDIENFDNSMVKISPPLEDLQISTSTHTISIEGSKAASTTYTIEFSREIKDIYGQKLTGNNIFEFKTEPLHPLFFSLKPGMFVMDPTSPASLTVYSRSYQNLALKVWRVQASDWLTFQRSYNKYHCDTTWLSGMPGKLIATDSIPIKGHRDSLITSRIELHNYLLDEKGHFLVWIGPTSYMNDVDTQFQNRMIRSYWISWIQLTNVGIDAWVDPSRLVVMTTGLEEAVPHENVKIKVDSLSGKTDYRGLITFDLPNNLQHSTIVASLDNDTAFFPIDLRRQSKAEQHLFYVFDDRQTYRPSDTVHIKGWVRKISRQIGSDPEIPDITAPLTYTVIDPRDTEITRGKVLLSVHGGFDFSFVIPDDANLGNAIIQLQSGEHKHSHSISIQNYRSPEYEVAVQINNELLFSGQNFTISAEASYFTEGNISSAPINWVLQTRRASYSPPNHSNYSFGDILPQSWKWSGLSSRTRMNEEKRFRGKTDNNGSHIITTSIDCSQFRTPVSLTVEAAVTNVNRQQVAAKASTIIHPASYYVGLKNDENYFDSGEKVSTEWIVTDIDGKIVSNVPVLFTAEKVHRCGYGRIERDTIAESFRECMVSSNKPVTWDFIPKEGGFWRITATLVDKKGRANSSSIIRWVRDNPAFKQNRVDIQKVTIIPDKDIYQSGDTAKLLIQSPFTPAEGFLLLSRYGKILTKRFSLTESTKEINVEISDDYVPNFHAQVHLTGTRYRTGADGLPDSLLPMQPSLANGSLIIPVSKRSRTLLVTATPNKQYLKPNENTQMKITVFDANNTAVQNAEVAIAIVDEGVLALSNYNLKNPLDLFYPLTPSLVLNHHNRPLIFLENTKTPDINSLRNFHIGRDFYAIGERKIESVTDFPSLSSEKGDSRVRLAPQNVIRKNNVYSSSSPPVIRSEFNPLVKFIPAGITNHLGELVTDIQLPDNLTRYRIMVIAADGPKRFGTAETTITARLPLMVRPSAPRFLYLGDHFELPVVLHNQTDSTLPVSVAVRSKNVKIYNESYIISIPAHSNHEVRFSASAINSGTAHFQVSATVSNYTDATSFELPVYTPVTTETFATYGTLDNNVVRYPIERPENVWNQIGGVQITTSSTALQGLTDAFVYLYNYPFTSSEQLASRLLSAVALSDVLHAFNVPEIPSQEQINERIVFDITELTQRQNKDGGFGFWSRDQQSDPFASLHVIHALIRAQNKGYSIPTEIKSKAINYVKLIERHIPHSFSESAFRTITAYSLYVRAINGDYDEDKARSLLRVTPVEQWNIESLGWFLYVFSRSPESTEVKNIVRHLHNLVEETSDRAQFNHSFAGNDGYHVFYSPRRGDAVVLEALMKAQPKSDLIIKLVRGLLAQRRSGRWRTTTENCFVLLALDTYFRSYEMQTVDFVARAWVGEEYVGGDSFKGRTAQSHQLTIPMDYLANKDRAENLVLQKDGSGRMYYRIALNYAPKSQQIQPMNNGFQVERHYMGVDNNNDVLRLEDGTWKIKAGAKVRVTVKMSAQSHRHHVALVDPLPAGLEPLNPTLAVTSNLSSRRHTGSSFNHKNLRDDRAEAFVTHFHGNTISFAYNAIATTPGEFFVPPAKAEEMYAPETFGRSGSDRVVVR
ncbi:Uncharacterized protein CHISP_3238 [Chitinispirillum alkaliphilum]|nr:Uncharacterized protein CHISP_3238 [Chitinispirillum alkaliphilum]